MHPHIIKTEANSNPLVAGLTLPRGRRPLSDLTSPIRPRDGAGLDFAILALLEIASRGNVSAFILYVFF